MNEKLICSVGVFAHNEAGNIIKLLQALEDQRLVTAEIAEIIVVSSASTDATDSLVTEFAAEHPRVRLITQAKREGKSAAINVFLAEAKHPLAVVISGDVIPEEHTLERLLSVFSDPRIGATGGRPVPVNDPHTFMGYAVHLLWRLHHRMALISPKLGEMIAFRRIMDQIPRDSAVDEASIEAMIRKAGLRLKYVGNALIRNKGPENFRDFVKQRRRIQNGHLWLKKVQNYSVSSQDGGTLSRILISEAQEYPLQIPKLIAVMAMEMYCRALGSFDFYFLKKNPFTWDIARSTKDLSK
ncbi:MAG TPA: glycosyltransferase [Candidatus Cloacimonadota bacterium]|nr:glycosyltransferase [Candidatus Cloacimonadota bacterium]HPS39577.1 glycosyltransferase [Candidatus Cloacimonadota bacterium]